MPCVSRTHLLVGWVVFLPICVSHHGAGNSRDPLKGKLDSPEAASCKCSCGTIHFCNFNLLWRVFFCHNFRCCW